MNELARHAIIIVDSNETHRKSVVSHLSVYPDMDIAGVYPAAKEAVGAIEKLEGLLIVEQKQIYDIKPPDELNRKYETILIGNFEDRVSLEYAVNHFHILKYLNKPIDKVSFDTAIILFKKVISDKKILELINNKDESIYFTRDILYNSSGLSKRTFGRRLEDMQKQGIINIKKYCLIPFADALLISKHLGFLLDFRYAKKVKKTLDEKSR